MYLHPELLDHEHGEHRNHNGLAFASGHLGNESLGIELRLLAHDLRPAAALVGEQRPFAALCGGGRLDDVAEEARHHQDHKGLRVMRREWREAPVDHVTHPVGCNVREQEHIGLIRIRLLASLYQRYELLGVVEEVDRRELRRVVQAHVAVRLERRAHELLDGRLRFGRLGQLLVLVLVIGDEGEDGLGKRHTLAEHVLDHKSHVGRFPEEILPVGRLLIRHVPFEERGHRLLTELHAGRPHRRDRVHAVGRDLGEHGQREVRKVLDARVDARLQREEDGEQKVLLVRIALKLVKNLLSTPRDLDCVGAARRGQLEEEREQP